MTETARPSPMELWHQADGDGERYRQLLRQHGHLLSPGGAGYEDAPRNLPCGWPRRRDEVLMTEVRDQHRDLGLDEDSIADALATARDAGMFDVPGWT